MTSEQALIAEIHKLPTAVQPEAIDAALNLIKSLAKQHSDAQEKHPTRRAGSHPGVFVIGSNFDDPLEEFEEYM